MAAELIEGSAFYSYNLQTETPLLIDEVIYSLEPKDLPLLTGIGGDGVPILGREPCGNTVFWWQEEEAPLPRGTLNEALDASETGIDVAVGDAVKFAIGDQIRIEAETMLVTDINTSTDVLTVTRGTLGTTGATHVTGLEIVGLGTALPEGDIGSANYVGRDKFSNYTQIFSGKVQVSRTEQAIRKYGVPNELNHQMMKRTQHLMLGVEQAAVYGVKHETSATRIRSTGGLASFITTNIDTTSEWLTVDSIETQQQLCYDLGGMFTHLMARPSAFAALNNISGNERIQTVTVEDSRRGRVRAQSVMTEFGEVTLCRNRWIRKPEAFGFTPQQFVMKVLQPLVTTKLAKTDDTDSYSMVTELGFKVKGQDHMAKFTGLNQSAAIPAGIV